MTQFAVQDQDGLGTCYANAASVLIQGSLQWTNPISYHQLALAHAVRENGQGGRLVNPNNSYVGEGGWVCRSVEAAQTIGFCTADQFRLDVHGSVDPWSRQSDAIMAYARLLDGLGDRTNHSEAQWTNFASQLAQKLHNRNRLCRQNSHAFMSGAIADALPNYIISRLQSEQAALDRLNTQASTPAIEADKVLRQSWVNAYTRVRDNALTSTPAADNPDVRTWSLNPAARTAIAQSSAQYLPQLQAASPAQDARAFFSGTVGLPTVVSPLNALHRMSGPNDLPVALLNHVDARRVVTRAYVSMLDCGYNFDEHLASNMRPQEMFEQACQNFTGTLTPELQRAMDSANAMVANLRSQLGKNLEGRMRGFMEIVSPECAAQMEQNRVSLRNRRCESMVLNENMKTGRQNRYVLAGLTTTDETEAVRITRDWAVERLCANRPITVSVCTDFMRSAAADTKFCQRRERSADGSNKHGNHAMAVVGYDIGRDGKTRMLVQNSWGRSCPFTDKKIAEGKSAECEVDENKQLTGRFWIDADVLIRNSYDISAITPEGDAP